MALYDNKKVALTDHSMCHAIRTLVAVGGADGYDTAFELLRRGDHALRATPSTVSALLRAAAMHGKADGVRQAIGWLKLHHKREISSTHYRYAIACVRAPLTPLQPAQVIFAPIPLATARVPRPSARGRRTSSLRTHGSLWPPPASARLLIPRRCSIAGIRLPAHSYTAVASLHAEDGDKVRPLLRDDGADCAGTAVLA